MYHEITVYRFKLPKSVDVVQTVDSNGKAWVQVRKLINLSEIATQKERFAVNLSRFNGELNQ
jgi:hypothetical protein